MEAATRYVAFAGARLLAEGSAAEVLPVLKHRLEQGSEPALLFDVASGQQVELDLTRSLGELLERESGGAARGPGRPRLGVISREVSLLPRHWQWLEAQPSGASAAIRRLVEHALRQNPGHERARRIRASLNHVLTALAGDRPNYEEATRALFADDVARFEALIARWPKDLRAYAAREARAAHAAERSAASRGEGGDA